MFPAKYQRFVDDYSAGLLSEAPGYCSGAGPRFLAISDLHGANRLDLAGSVIDREADAGREVSAVLLLGDLANLGRALELRLARFAPSLRQLPVPVLVVLGNHDKHGPRDTSVARYLSRVPNVRLMQRGKEYERVAFGPVRIGGFDDPRFFGDDNRNNAAKQHPAREAFLADADARGRLPDIVMIHEPYAAGGPEALWIGGHMHAPLVDVPGRRVQVGMFTDGVFYYKRRAHRRAPSNFVLLAAGPPSTHVASVTFRWSGRRPVYGSTEESCLPQVKK